MSLTSDPPCHPPPLFGIILIDFDIVSVGFGIVFNHFWIVWGHSGGLLDSQFVNFGWGWRITVDRNHSKDLADWGWRWRTPEACRDSPLILECQLNLVINGWKRINNSPTPPSPGASSPMSQGSGTQRYVFGKSNVFVLHPPNNAGSSKKWDNP